MALDALEKGDELKVNEYIRELNKKKILIKNT